MRWYASICVSMHQLLRSTVFYVFCFQWTHPPSILSQKQLFCGHTRAVLNMPGGSPQATVPVVSWHFGILWHVFFPKKICCSTLESLEPILQNQCISYRGIPWKASSKSSKSSPEKLHGTGQVSGAKGRPCWAEWQTSLPSMGWTCCTMA